MAVVTYQGRVATDGSTRITCTGDLLTIHNIIINNTVSNYVFTLDRNTTGPGIHEIPIYELDLDAGDSIRDTEQYILNKGNYLQLTSSVPGTTYYINATLE